MERPALSRPPGASLLKAVASPSFRPAPAPATTEVWPENTVTGDGAEMVLTFRESWADRDRQAPFRRQQRRGQQQQHTTSTTTTVAALEMVAAIAAGRTTSSSAGVTTWRHSGVTLRDGALRSSTARLRRVW